MKKKGPSFHLYPENDAASRLSVAGGGVKLLSTLVLVAAILYSAAALWVILRVTMAWGMGGALHHLLDDAEEGLFGLFVLWGLFAACRYAASVLQAKAKMLAQSGKAEAETHRAEGGPTVTWDSETRP